MYKKGIAPTLFTSIVCAFFACQQTIDTPTDWQAMLNGLTNLPEQADNPYLTAGDKAYIIGQQNGDFPDMGGHAPGEMGGVWNQRIKLLDGFWIKLVDENGTAKWIDKATSYTTYPEGSSFRYEKAIDGITVDRFQFCPDETNGAVITYTLRNSTLHHRRLAGFPMDRRFAILTRDVPLHAEGYPLPV